jgi:osmoprotectant transport system substrate-binding protein
MLPTLSTARPARSARPLVLACLSLLLVGCGLALPGVPSQSQTQTRGKLNVVGFNFAESTVLVHLYAKPLAAKGYPVETKPNLGTRETLQPALTTGQIDMYLGYAATDLEFVNKGAGEATADITVTLPRLRERYKALGVDVLDAAPAVDKTAFAVTRATADKYHLSKMSDLGPVASELVLGAPPQCPQRPFCLPGLERVYGAKFKDFKPLDVGGPLTKQALESGEIDVALVLSSDGAIPAKGFVVLDDDRHLELADNVVPMIRSAVNNPEIAQILNTVSSRLTTEDLALLNKRNTIDREDPEALADEWLKAHGLLTGL